MRSALEQPVALEADEVVVDRGGRREADRLRDLADGRRIATLLHGLRDALEDPSAALGVMPGHGLRGLRFVVTGPSGSKVKVQVIYRGLLSSLLGILDGGTVSTNGTWQPSPAVGMLGGVLPLLTQSVQFRFVATSGTPRIDDVYLDPMKSG